MIAAVYARKSTDQIAVADDAKSVTRQIEHAKAYATKKGWTCAEDYVYMDDGISGAEFVKRPGFLRLMNALKPKPAFQVLIMSGAGAASASPARADVAGAAGDEACAWVASFAASRLGVVRGLCQWEA
jgi:hypothetical protein